MLEAATAFIVRTTDWRSPALLIFRRRLAVVSLMTSPWPAPWTSVRFPAWAPVWRPLGRPVWTRRQTWVRPRAWARLWWWVWIPAWVGNGRVICERFG